MAFRVPPIEAKERIPPITSDSPNIVLKQVPHIKLFLPMPSVILVRLNLPKTLTKTFCQLKKQYLFKLINKLNLKSS